MLSQRQRRRGVIVSRRNMSRVCAVTLIYVNVTLSAFIFISKIYPDIIGPYVVTYKYSDHYSYLPSRRTEYVIYIESDADT